MRTINYASSVAVFTLLSLTGTCQNGPTQHSVTLNWTQSTTPGVTANCVYRGSTSGIYSMPALFCSSAPITSYRDTSVAGGQTYHYAVTAQVGPTESAYSNDVTITIPVSPNAPAGLATGVVALLDPPDGSRPFLVATVDGEKGRVKE